MKKMFIAGLLAGSVVLLSASAAQAQVVAPGPATTLDAARTRRQQQMSPEDAARDQQLQILEARTGNTSFGAGTSGPARQYDKNGDAFLVRKFKGMPGQRQKRGMSRLTPGINPKGKPLVHDHDRKKKFLLF